MSVLLQMSASFYRPTRQPSAMRTTHTTVTVSNKRVHRISVELFKRHQCTRRFSLGLEGLLEIGTLKECGRTLKKFVSTQPSLNRTQRCYRKL